jgi:hypothetical protein
MIASWTQMFYGNELEMKTELLFFFLYHSLTKRLKMLTDTYFQAMTEYLKLNTELCKATFGRVWMHT